MEVFRAARTLIDAGLPNDAVSRAYYAAFHLMRAAALSRGVDPRTHAGTLNVFNRELTRKGTLPPFNKLLTGLQSAREVADYDAGVSFTLDEARALVAEADAFATAVLDLLRAEGGGSTARPDAAERGRVTSCRGLRSPARRRTTYD